MKFSHLHSISDLHFDSHVEHCSRIKGKSCSSKWKNTVPQCTFKLNTALATPETYDLKGHMLKFSILPCMSRCHQWCLPLWSKSFLCLAHLLTNYMSCPLDPPSCSHLNNIWNEIQFTYDLSLLLFQVLRPQSFGM